MNLEISRFGLVLLIVAGLLVFALMRWLRRLPELLRMSKSRRETFQRVLPIAETLVALVFLLSAVPLVLGNEEHPEYTAIGRALILLGFAWVSWFAIRDFINGVVIRSGLLIRVGDHIRISDAVSGRLRRLGYRTLAIDTDDGKEAIIPYSLLSRQSIVRTPVVDGVCRHAFKVAVEPTIGVVDTISTIRTAALTHHWASLARDPVVEVSGDTMCSVTVFALTNERSIEIEEAIRGALAEASAAQADEAATPSVTPG